METSLEITDPTLRSMHKAHALLLSLCISLGSYYPIIGGNVTKQVYFLYDTKLHQLGSICTYVYKTLHVWRFLNFVAFVMFFSSSGDGGVARRPSVGRCLCYPAVLRLGSVG